jgi:flagellar basal-body rod modification protein FlgD
MIAQMAQFSSLAGISEMNDTLRAIADQIGAQTALLTDIRAATAAAPGTNPPASI